jgi:glycosyltransferase involved in cell wall biosynthesis
LRITFVCPTLNVSGGIKVVSIYAKYLSEAGHDVTIVSQRERPSFHQFKRRVRNFLQKKPPDRGIKSTFFANVSAIKHVEFAGDRPVIKDIPDGDLLVATWWETAEWASQFPQSKGAKIYFIQHHEVFDFLPLSRVTATYRLPFKKIVVAKWLRALMAQQYGDPHSVLVSNAVDSTQFFAPPRAKQSVPTIGFIASEASYKGMEVAIAVVRQLKKNMPHLNVLSFGLDDIPISVVNELKIEFVRSPPQSDIRLVYAKCDVWLSTSHSEGFNLPTMEAMACRTPVVSTMTGWPEEAIVGGQNGFLAEVGNVDQLVQGCIAILDASPDEWAAMSKCAFDTANEYSWKESSMQFENALKNFSGQRTASIL